MKQKLNICMLFEAQDKSNPDVLGPANRKGIPSYLINFSHAVTWIIPYENVKGLQQLHQEKINIFAIPYTRFFNDNLLPGKIINRVLNAPKRIYYILKIFRQGNYNLIYVKGNMLDEVVAVYIRARYKIPLVVDSEPPGMQRETYSAGFKKRTVLSHLIGKWHALVTMYVMRKADLITPSSRWFGNTLVQSSIPEHKLMPYPNAVDIARLLRGNGKTVREEYGLNGSQVIIYVGTLDRARNLNMLLEAFSKVIKSHKNIKLLMVGDGNDREKLQQFAVRLNMQHEVIFTGHIKGSKIPDFIAASDIGVSPVPPLDCYRIGSPVKLFEYMGSAKPVVANEEIFDQEEVLEQSGGGILVKYDPDAFADALSHLLNNKEKANDMGKKGKEWVINNRSYEILARQLEKRYLALINRQAK